MCGLIDGQSLTETANYDQSIIGSAFGIQTGNVD